MGYPPSISATVTRIKVPFFRIPIEIRIQIYHLLLTNHDHPTLSIRTENACLWELRESEPRRRTKYRYVADRFRARTAESTYHILQNPGIYPAILCTNRQIHSEASDVLFSHHIFDFGTEIESIIPFFFDLTPIALISVKRINLLKRALPYTKDYDRCEWANACAFISQKMSISQLDLMIEGGRPASR